MIRVRCNHEPVARMKRQRNPGNSWISFHSIQATNLIDERRVRARCSLSTEYEHEQRTRTRHSHYAASSRNSPRLSSIGRSVTEKMIAGSFFDLFSK